MSQEGSLHGTRALNQRRRQRTVFTEEQLKELRRCFEQDRYPSARERQALAHKLNLGEYSVKIWFKNQRARHSRANSRRSGQLPGVQDSQPICLPSAPTPDGQPGPGSPAISSPSPSPPAATPAGPARTARPGLHSAGAPAWEPASAVPESSEEPTAPAPGLSVDPMDFGLPREHLSLFQNAWRCWMSLFLSPSPLESTPRSQLNSPLAFVKLRPWLWRPAETLCPWCLMPQKPSFETWPFRLPFLIYQQGPSDQPSSKLLHREAQALSLRPGLEQPKGTPFLTSMRRTPRTSSFTGLPAHPLDGRHPRTGTLINPMRAAPVLLNKRPDHRIG
ncbi:cone-rod homeobox protein-like [Erinaceus europaeus]|uniref:Cone-rod homeobox protein-like n=1 Tax=Erinaceus europaeus TaxID=9365 RepID=A0ABM3WVQ8_ERIEU|nr:cone-rod homeobox protein-like [Erinaceus europaeus]